MKIANLYAENFKRLRVVEIKPDGSLVQITGPNDSGKSSVLDALYAALAGKKAADPVPVRLGEESALIRLDLGKIKVTRRFSSDGTTSLVVETEEGARYGSPQTLLDKLLGNLTFDPLEFSRMDTKGRSATLRKLVPLEIDVDALTRANDVDFNARTGVNRQIKEAVVREKAARESIPMAVPERIDVSALVAEMAKASDHNTAIARLADARSHIVETIDSLRGVVEDKQRQIRELQAEVEQAEAGIKERVLALAGAAPLPDPINLNDLREQIEAAQRTNAVADRAARAKAEWEGLERELAGLEEQAMALTTTMDGRKREIAEALAAAKMPIEDLTFSDTFDVLYKGLPFEQASSAAQLRVSVAIAMAMNPQLRVLRIKDGSLLDESNLALVAEMAQQGDYQIWIERVDTTGKVGVVMEDGAVKDALQFATVAP